MTWQMKTMIQSGSAKPLSPSPSHRPSPPFGVDARAKVEGAAPFVEPERRSFLVAAQPRWGLTRIFHELFAARPQMFLWPRPTTQFDPQRIDNTLPVELLGFLARESLATARDEIHEICGLALPRLGIRPVSCPRKDLAAPLVYPAMRRKIRGVESRNEAKSVIPRLATHLVRTTN